MNKRSSSEGAETNIAETERVRLSNARTDRIINRLFFVGALGLCAYLATGYVKKDKDISNSLKFKAAEAIDGFLDADVKGFIFNINPDSVYSAIAKLDTGETCDIQFLAVANDSSKGSMFLDQVEIVDLGTCPLATSD